MNPSKLPSQPRGLRNASLTSSARLACHQRLGLFSALLCFASLQAWSAAAAQQKSASTAAQSKASVSKAESPASNAAESVPEAAPLPGDWAPELLDSILSSSNSSAREALYDAAFATGPDLIPQLEAALRDDRTAEFAAQCLAFFGGEKAMKTLATLMNDKRDLDLKRFYLGALGEYQDPDITQALIEAITKSDAEPDRTVTEAAIWALSVRSDPSLPAQLQQAEAQLVDFVIRDDVDNVREVISARTHYLGSAEGRKTGSSIPEAVHTYFIAALQSPLPSARRAGGAAQTAQPPPARTEIEHVTFTPDSTRALAHVTLSDTEGSANYDIVLQKQVGDWKVVSVWMNSETEKSEPKPVPKSKR